MNVLNIVRSKEHHVGFFRVVMPLVVIGCFVFACRSVTPDISARFGTPCPYKAKISAKRLMGGALTLEYSYTALRDTNDAYFKYLLSVSDVHCIVVHPVLGVLDSFELRANVGITGIEELKDSVSLTGSGFWLNTAAIEYDKVICDLAFDADGKRWHDAVELDLSPKDETMKAAPMLSTQIFIDEQTDSTVTFALLTQRNRGGTLDYFPSSEKLRVEILSPKSQVLFNSSTGFSFTQEVTMVDPRNKNDVKRYTYVWTGDTDAGEPIPEGKYKARLTLLSKPIPYIQTVDFEWKPRKR